MGSQLGQVPPGYQIDWWTRHILAHGFVQQRLCPLLAHQEAVTTFSPDLAAGVEEATLHELHQDLHQMEENRSQRPSSPASARRTWTGSPSPRRTSAPGRFQLRLRAGLLPGLPPALVPRFQAKSHLQTARTCAPDKQGEPATRGICHPPSRSTSLPPATHATGGPPPDQLGSIRADLLGAERWQNPPNGPPYAPLVRSELSASPPFAPQSRNLQARPNGAKELPT